MDIKFSELTNSELKFKLKEFEDEYEAIKNKITKLVDRMDELDLLFDKAKKELSKRGQRI